MTSYNIYPPIPTEALGPHSADNPQIPYHLNMILAKRRGLIAKDKTFKKKYEKYTKILNQLMWLNACSSGISIATGISSVAAFATFIGIPVSAVLGVAFIAGVIASGIISGLTKKYQQKCKKVMHLIDIIIPALVVFERVVSGALKNDVINEEEFHTLQNLHLETLNELTGVDCWMEAKHGSLVKKSLLEEINELKKSQGTRV